MRRAQGVDMSYCPYYSKEDGGAGDARGVFDNLNKEGVEA